MTTIPAEIATFTVEVRAALADLPADEVDELTEGLEADLAEAYADRDMPDPVAYASELRTAAGLPPQTAATDLGHGPRGALRSINSGFRTTAAQVSESLRDNPATASVLDFAVALRPFWWVLRAWVAYQLLATFFGSEGPVLPYEAGWWLVLLVLLVVSVQWGRGRWRNVWVLTPLIIVGNVVTAVALLPLFAATHAWSSPYEQAQFSQSQYAPESGHTGLRMDGEPLTNIYPYGSDGRPLSDVQLFGQDGTPLTPSRESDFDSCSDASCDELHPEPSRLETGESVRNVYPLTLVPMVYDELGELEPVPAAKARTPKAPFVKVPEVAEPATNDEKKAD